MTNFLPPPHFWSQNKCSSAWKSHFCENLKNRPKSLKKTTIVIHKFWCHISFLFLDGFTNHLWAMEPKHNTFDSPKIFFGNALTKRCKRLKRTIDEKRKNDKVYHNWPISYPFYPFLKFWWKIGKITNFPPPPHFYSPKSASSAGKIDFGENLKNRPLTGKNLQILIQLFLKAYIFFAFGSIYKPFMGDGAQT